MRPGASVGEDSVGGFKFPGTLATLERIMYIHTLPASLSLIRVRPSESHVSFIGMFRWGRSSGNAQTLALQPHGPEYPDAYPKAAPSKHLPSFERYRYNPLLSLVILS